MSKKATKPPIAKPQTKPPNPSTTIVGETLLEWTAMPYKYNRKKTAWLVVAIVAFPLLVYWSSRDFVYSLIAAMVLMGAFVGFVLPTSYVVTTEGIFYKDVFNKAFKKWDAFKRYTKYDDGLQLWFSQSQMRERLLRGIFVYYGSGNQQEVLAIIDKYVLLGQLAKK
ncbi:MAG: hypothetical protein Q8N36_04215 [bacterium]|nr:hypothetical protein [bacterium]